MELKDAIEKRRSIRSFKERVVSKDKIEDIINAGILAPSTKNRQPWYFLVLTGEKKNTIANIMNNKEINAKLKNDEDIIKFGNSSFISSKAIKEASVLILIFKEPDNNWLIGDTLSIGACIENMCLRAVDLGLGSLWIRDVIYTRKEIKEYLNETKELVCALAVGYPRKLPNKRPRKGLESVVKWY